MPRCKRVLLTAVLVGFPLLAAAQPLEGQQSGLSLLNSVRVDVQLIGAAPTTGLTSASVRLAVENRLRDSSVSVRDADDRSERGDPQLRVAVQAVNAAGGFAFLVSVQLVERVVTYRKYAELVFDGVLPHHTHRLSRRAGDLTCDQMGSSSSRHDQPGQRRDLHPRGAARVRRSIRGRLSRRELV